MMVIEKVIKHHPLALCLRDRSMQDYLTGDLSRRDVHLLAHSPWLVKVNKALDLAGVR